MSSRIVERIGGLSNYLIAALAGSTVSIRTVTDAPMMLELAPLIDRAIVVLGLSVTVAGFLPSVVGDLALWTLYAVSFYVFLPELIPESLGGIASDRPLIAILSLLSVSLAVVLSTTLNDFLATAAGRSVSSPGVDSVLPTVGFITTVGAVCIAVYLQCFTPGVLRDGTGTRKLYERLDPHDGADLRRHRAEPSTRTRVGVLIAAFSVVLVFVVASFTLGMLTAIVSSFSPFPELLIAGTAIVSASPTRFRPDRVDVESQAYQVVPAVFRNPKGLLGSLTLLMASIGCFLVLLMGLVDLPVKLLNLYGRLLLAVHGIPPTTTDLLTDSASLGSSVLTALAGLLFFWYWLRIVRRFSSFLAHWEGDSGATTNTGKPPYSVVLPMVLFGVGMGYVLAVRGASDRIVEWFRLVLGLCWPLGIYAALKWVRVTRRAAPRSPSTDRFAGLAVLGGPVACLLLVATVAGNWFVFWVVVSVFVIGAGCWVTPDVMNYARTQSGAAKHLPSFVGISLGLTLVSIGVLVRNTPLTLLFAGGIVIALSIFEAVQRAGE